MPPESDELIPVRIHASDGWTTVMHTREELERYFRGVDVEVSWAMDGFNEPEIREGGTNPS